MNADPHRPVRWPALQKISVDQQLCESSGNRRGVFLRRGQRAAARHHVRCVLAPNRGRPTWGGTRSARGPRRPRLHRSRARRARRHRQCGGGRPAAHWHAAAHARFPARAGNVASDRSSPCSLTPRSRRRRLYLSTPDPRALQNLRSVFPSLIRQFVDQSGDNNIGTDEPAPFSGRPGGVLSRWTKCTAASRSAPRSGRARPRHSNSCSTSGSPTPPASGGSDGSDTHPARSAADHSRRPPPPGGHVAPVA
jgi:hypothetical protein